MADKSPGQQLLDRLLAVRNRLGGSARQLEQAMVAIRGRPPGQAEPPTPGQPAAETRFFAAAEAVTAELERIAAAIETEVADLAARF